MEAPDIAETKAMSGSTLGGVDVTSGPAGRRSLLLELVRKIRRE